MKKNLPENCDSVRMSSLEFMSCWLSTGQIFHIESGLFFYNGDFAGFSLLIRPKIKAHLLIKQYDMMYSVLFKKRGGQCL